MPTALDDDVQAPDASTTDRLRALFVAPRHPGEPDWPWITRFSPMDHHQWQSIFIDHTFKPFPKLTRLYVQRQYAAARRSLAAHDIAFTFSTDICLGLTGRRTRSAPDAPLIYVGFTQDGPWSREKIDRLKCAMGRYDMVTVFTDEERDLYIARYSLPPHRIRTIPIHTDEGDGYEKYPDQPPLDHEYVLSMGSPNRCFQPVAIACQRMNLPLVIITRPWHQLDDLAEMRALGATVITDADKLSALTYLKHAKMAVMAFDDPGIPGGFTTLVHGMFMRTPFILTDCLGMREHVVDGQTGFVTPHADQPALESAMYRVWNESGLAEQFAAAGLARARQRHAPESAAKQFASLIGELIAKS